MNKTKETSFLCRCCESNQLEIVLDLGKQPWGNHFVPIDQAIETPKFPLELYFCKNCSMVQLNYTVPKEFMFVEHNYLSGTTNSLRQHFCSVVEKILSRISLTSNEYVLDIGGNDGTFLTFFKNKNISVLNVDSGKKQAQLSEENDVPCINQFFNKDTAENILKQRGHAKVIHGSGIFFHLEELHSVFFGIKKILHPEGIVVAEFIYLPEMVKNCAFDQIYHEHLLYYTIQSFDRLLNGHDLAIYDAEIDPIHGGSCIAYIGHQERVKPTEKLLDLIEKEKVEGFDQINVYKEFAKQAFELKEKLVKMIKEFRKQDKKIQALGAPVKGSTIINYCGFTHNEIECAVEINRLKCDTYMPGTKIPVYHQDEVQYPDIYLLLSWNFKDEIIAKLSDFREAGGKILIPIPKPEMI